MNLEFEFSEIAPSVFLFKFTNQYQLTSAFARLQEFYEFPNNKLRQQYFTLEDFLDNCYLHYKKISYFDDWAGFNLPGESVKEFYNIFHTENNGLLKKEKQIFDIICEKIFPKYEQNNFYIIGVYSKKDIDHELAHSFYSLSKKYKNCMDSLIKKLNKTIFLANWLKDLGYAKPEVNDEIQAYLSTSSKEELSNLGMKLKIKNVSEFRKTFLAFKRFWTFENINRDNQQD